ncbi:HEAT repeat domain-containing protein [Oligoflexus tunisiensis]|uniref:HEAT repeat domain-containing protein n=1 Tax=Oligoflexus tunisiensis TaxID=708132 RepID=UPI00114CB05A|nr:HEAT repeat domain-containing protein [Oligoflexus tunisiensis]
MSHIQRVLVPGALGILFVILCQKVLKANQTGEPQDHKFYARGGYAGQATPPAPDDPSAGKTPWQTRIMADMEAFKKENNKDYQALMELRPRITRSRSLKFIDARLAHPRAASVLLYRLMNDNAKPEVREALVAAISQSSGEYADAMLDLMAKEPAAAVRARMVSVLRHADEQATLQGLQLGFKDPSPLVRAAAARTIGKLEKNPQLSNLLMTNLKDQDSTVQIAAIQSARILKLSEASGTLEALLSSSNPSVRLESLYAIGQLAPDVLGRVPNLEKDADHKVSSAAIRLRHEAGFRGPPPLK